MKDFFRQDNRLSTFRSTFITMRLLLVEDHADLAEWVSKALI
jgi:hypothetical protein